MSVHGRLPTRVKQLRNCLGSSLSLQREQRSAKSGLLLAADLLTASHSASQRHLGRVASVG